MGDKAVVTGVAGFIGTHLAEHLLEKGYMVVGIDNFHPYYSEEIKRRNINEVRNKAENLNAEFEFFEGSILKSSDLDKLPESPEFVFHLAAVAGTRVSMSNPSEHIEVNVHGTSKLIESFDSIGKFVFSSSSSVYGEVSADELPVDETSCLSPETPYALSKMNAEELVKMYSGIYDFDYAILRPFTVYGPRQRPDQAVTKFIRRIIDEETIRVYGDGYQSRKFTYVEDLVKGILAAAEKGDGIYNLSGRSRLTVNQLIEIIDKKVDQNVSKTYVEKHEGDVRHTDADISKAKEELDYSPEVSIEQGIENCVEWVENSFYSSKSRVELRHTE